jgi:hypothetical protein
MRREREANKCEQHVLCIFSVSPSPKSLKLQAETSKFNTSAGNSTILYTKASPYFAFFSKD